VGTVVANFRKPHLAELISKRLRNRLLAGNPT
jgi:hypothetical protein